jgi:hypothetical protein
MAGHAPPMIVRIKQQANHNLRRKTILCMPPPKGAADEKKTIGVYTKP